MILYIYCTSHSMPSIDWFWAISDCPLDQYALRLRLYNVSVCVCLCGVVCVCTEYWILHILGIKVWLQQLFFLQKRNKYVLSMIEMVSEQHLIKCNFFSWNPTLARIWPEVDTFGWVCARSPRAPRHCPMIRHPPRLEGQERSGTPGAPGHKGHLDWASRPWLCRGHNFHSTRLLLCAKSALKKWKHCSTAANVMDYKETTSSFILKLYEL